MTNIEKKVTDAIISLLIISGYKQNAIISLISLLIISGYKQNTIISYYWSFHSSLKICHVGQLTCVTKLHVDFYSKPPYTCNFYTYVSFYSKPPYIYIYVISIPVSRSPTFLSILNYRISLRFFLF